MIKSRGMTLVEIMIVLIIIVLISIPTITFMISSRRAASKGSERLGTLMTARLILERTRRDIKSLCFSDYSQVKFSGDEYGPTFEFPIFPSEEYSTAYSGVLNPVNIVKYTFDPKLKILTRNLTVNPLLLSNSSGANTRSEILGEGVEIFTIEFRRIFGQNFYDVHVECRSKLAANKAEATHLRTAVRSDFEALLERHRFQIPNRFSVISLPPSP